MSRVYLPVRAQCTQCSLPSARKPVSSNPATSLAASLRGELADAVGALAETRAELAQARKRIAELEARLKQNPRNSSQAIRGP